MSCICVVTGASASSVGTGASSTGVAPFPTLAGAVGPITTTAGVVSVHSGSCLGCGGMVVEGLGEVVFGLVFIKLVKCVGGGPTDWSEDCR